MFACKAELAADDRQSLNNFNAMAAFGGGADPTGYGDQGGALAARRGRVVQSRLQLRIIGLCEALTLGRAASQRWSRAPYERSIASCAAISP